ncbi:transporter substrate-binding domain-containing protein [Variovorax sp. PBL-E5]|uniref:transporter substrate-binding domain-containing protein n=1 Tax=Variovorax sp. PBL-E5 TaxID=434014 RepID=UPI0013198636|nr:transporter substrate-binding domain-containing protein [Variovorax sp. PBL-E5]VTU45448.1 Glutamine-binding periplasmic protein precursor [Variovorax sp. PBL-E5]
MKKIIALPCRQLLALALGLSTAIAVYAGDPAPAAANSAGALATLASRVPEKFRQAGKIVVGTSPTYIPLEFKDPETQKLMGLDIDLVEEIGKRLGLKVEWQSQSLDQIINSIDTGRIDIGASVIADIAARRDKTDFVDYFATGTQLFAFADRAKELKTVEDVCGKTVAVNRNGIFFIRLKEVNQSVCVGKGRPEMQFSLTDKTADARMNLMQGRAVAAAASVDSVRFLNEDPKSPDKGKFVLIGKPATVDLAGLAFAKSNAALRDVVAEALASMIKDGSYAKIFSAWNLGYAKVDQVTINTQARQP